VNDLEGVRFFILLAAPAVALLVLCICLEARDTTQTSRWAVVRNNPLRDMVYDGTGRIRPWFKPVVIGMCVSYLAALSTLGYLIFSGAFDGV
jgi:hypothetical protein